MQTSSPESQESSSPIVTRAVAAGLTNQSYQIYEFPGWQKLALRVLGLLPQAIGRYVISRKQAFAGVRPDAVRHLSIDDLMRVRLEEYRNLPERLPAITVGVAQGGATAHLALALGGPFLPEAFVLTLKGGSRDGDVTRYLHRSLDLAIELARQNASAMTIQHYDPVHDGWLTRWVNQVRLKLIDLPEVYAEFIRRRLEPGSEVLYLEGGANWLRYRVGERSVFQVGGWGDISAEEFLESSERIQEVGRNEGLRHFDWRLAGYSLERGPESEWGSEPGLGQALQAFCDREGYRFARISYPEPNGFSYLAFRAVEYQLKKLGREPSGALIEMFSQFDSTAVVEGGLLPLWWIYNTQDSLRFLKEMIRLIPQSKPVFFSPLSTFSITPDLVPWRDWERALKGLEWANVGTRPSHYPADAEALVNWNRPLKKWVKSHPNRVADRLSLDEICRLHQQVMDEFVTG